MSYGTQAKAFLLQYKAKPIQSMDAIKTAAEYQPLKDRLEILQNLTKTVDAGRMTMQPIDVAAKLSDGAQQLAKIAKDLLSRVQKG